MLFKQLKMIRQCSKSSLRFHRRQKRIYEKASVCITQSRHAVGNRSLRPNHLDAPFQMVVTDDR